MKDHSHPPASDTFDLLCELMRRRSITPADDGCQQLLAERLTPLGFHCESMPFGDVQNLWARRGNSAPLFCFAGHTDVVPPGQDTQWMSDPFLPEVRDGFLYGRGAADMKASLAAFVTALDIFLARRPNHKGSIALLITSDEEGRARDGTRRVVEALKNRGEQLDYCLVGEPSSQATPGDVIRVGRRGSLSGELTIRGLQGHVAYPDLASNPIATFAPALAELCAKRWDNGNESFPPTSFQIVRLQADGGAVNVIPGELRARFNFRYSTVWHHSELRNAVESLLKSHGLDFQIDWHLSGEPFLTDGGPLVDAVVASIEDVQELSPTLSTGGGTSDGRFISPAGADVVELGPVNASIHKVDEHIRVRDIGVLVELYTGILERMLS